MTGVAETRRQMRTPGSRGAVLPTRPLGETGLRLPVAWVGTATFGGLGSDPALHGLGVDPGQAPAILDAAFDAGMHVVDTADSYTGGMSERAIGAWLAGGTRSAQGVVVATKTGIRLPYPTRDLSPRHIEEAVHGSLQRLGVDRIDLLMSHRPDPATPVRLVVEKFAELIDRGVVGHVGACNVTATEVEELLAAAAEAGVPRIEWVQNRFNVVVHAGEARVLNVCRANGLGYVAHSVLAGGVLGGRRVTDPVPAGSRLAVKPEVYDRYRTPEVSAAIAAFTSEAASVGVPVAVLAQAWVLNVPGISAVVAGPQHPGHIPASVAAAQLALDPELHERIGSLFAEPLTGASAPYGRQRRIEMPEYDLVVRAGTVVDGTGRDPLSADVAVRNGVIAEVGRVSGRGAREITADGAVVAPGFVDVHTHYDGQAVWDSRMQPSSWHGVTTVVMGNCGVGFAPVAPRHRQMLIELMEGVEDIPGTALHEGLGWEWESFGEYLDMLERKPHDVDVAAQVPHAALRFAAMGERAAAFEAATDGEIEEMAQLAREAVGAGALGFTTSRTINHKSKSGTLTPIYGAHRRELTAIAAAVGQTNTGVLQLITDFDDLGEDFALMRQMVAVSGRPLTVSLIQLRGRPRQYREVLARISQANAEGHPIKAQVAARSMGIMLGLQCTLHPFVTNPVWRSISHLPVAEQAARMADPGTRAAILGAQTDEKLPNVPGGLRTDTYGSMYEFSEVPEYEPPPGDCVAARAERAGRTPEDLVYDILIKDDGRRLIFQPFTNYADGNLDAVHEMLVHEFTIPGLSDGGAHVASICDGSFPTTLLQLWARDRDRDRLSLPFVVRRQCRETALAVGLRDRGLLKPGYKADLNVIDLDNLRLHAPAISYDLPAGGRRFLQRADGYRHTVVSGVETYADGQPTGELPGRLVRGTQDAR